MRIADDAVVPARYLAPSSGASPAQVVVGRLAGQEQEIADLEGPSFVRGESRPPGGVARKVGLGILADDLDEDLGNDAATHCAQPIAAALNRRLSQDVQPQWRLTIPVAESQFVAGQWRRAERASHGLPGREAGALASLQVPRRQRAIGVHLNRTGDRLGEPDE